MPDSGRSDDRQSATQYQSSERMAARQELILEQLSALGGDHEKRIRFLERVVGYGAGAAGVIMFFLGKLKII